MAARRFTRDEAQTHVPWLAQTFDEIAPWRERARELNSESRALMERMRGNGGRKSHDRMSQLSVRIEEARSHLERALESISERGILVKGIEPGLVDFPSMMDGREVYLCWREGETQIDFWHDVDAGFAGRRPL